MKTSVFQYAVAALACLGVVVPRPYVLADDNLSGRPMLPPSGVLDVRLGDDNSLSGHLVHHNGAPVVNAAVVLRHNGKILAGTNTDEAGAFRIEQVAGGVCDLAVSNHVATIRIWPAASAPPSAEAAAVFILTNRVVRGQNGCDDLPCDACEGLGCDACDGCDYYGTPRRRRGYLFGRDGLLWGAAAVTGLVLGAVALGQVNDLEDDVDALISP